MRKYKSLVATIFVLILCSMVTPVMAIGPEQAAEVGNNPNLSIAKNGNPILDTPSGVHNLWHDHEDFNHWVNASIGKGKINNAVKVGPTADVTLLYLLTHLSEYENTWIYFTQIGFKAFLIYAQGMPEPDAAIAAALYPEGVYWHLVFVG